MPGPEEREPLTEEQRKARKARLTDAARKAERESVKWDEVEAALEALVDTGVRSPLLALANRIDPGTYQRLSIKVMKPRKEAALAKRRELQQAARARKEANEQRAVAESERRARAHRAQIVSIVKAELAQLNSEA